MDAKRVVYIEDNEYFLKQFGGALTYGLARDDMGIQVDLRPANAWKNLLEDCT